MNKTVTANISGIIFHIELDAYEMLNQYLNTIRKYFHDSDGSDEIMADIESRIAELFKEGMEAGKEVIIKQNIQKVIEIMGEPEQYMDEDAQDNFQSTETTGSNFKSRKLFRDPDDNVIGGVCSGLSYYFGLDKIWFRAAFLIAFFGFGFGFIFYLILWIIIPSPKTTAEKLEMKGEPINIENIGNSIKDEFKGFKKKVNEKDTKAYARKAENSIYRFFNFLSKILYYIFKFILKILGVALVFGGVIALISILTIAFGGPFNINLNNANINGSWSADFADIYFSSPGLFYFGLVGVLLVILIPILGLLYGGLKLLFKIPSSNRAVSISAVSLWIIGLILIIITVASTASEYSSKQNLTEIIILEELTSDTLLLSSMEETYSGNSIFDVEMFVEGEHIYLNALSLDVIKSKDDNIKLKLSKSASGSNRKEAGKRAETIDFSYEYIENELSIGPLINIPYKTKFRNQDLKISLMLPVGKTVYLNLSSRDLIYDIDNLSNTYDGKMISHHWLMTEKGLRCTDCEWIETESVENTELEEIVEYEVEETSINETQ